MEQLRHNTFVPTARHKHRLALGLAVPVLCCLNAASEPCNRCRGLGLVALRNPSPPPTQTRHQRKVAAMPSIIIKVACTVLLELVGCCKRCGDLLGCRGRSSAPRHPGRALIDLDGPIEYG